MPTLNFRSGDGTEQQVELREELSVGREAGNDVVLKDNGVSRRHCKFFVADDGMVYVEDLGSANGTFLDGQQLAEPTALQEGSKVTLGTTEISLAARRATPKRATAARPAAGNGAAGPARPARPSAEEPAAPAKAGGGNPPKRATRMMTASELNQRLAQRPPPRAPAGKGEASRPKLKGVSGPWANLSFDVGRSKMLVGRVAPAEILLEDDSVSRRHAEVFKTGSMVGVRDLGSANGTFVNGERISEAQLEPGDVVRFGVVELSYTGPGGAREAPGMSPGKKKALLFGGVGLLVLASVGALVSGNRDGPVVTNGGGPDPAAGESVSRLAGRCKAYADPDSPQLDWVKAVETCGKALDGDPSLTELRPLKRKAEKAIEDEKLLKEAKLKAGVGQDEQVLLTLMKIPSDSYYFVAARREFAAAAERLEKKARSDCKSDFAATLYAQAVKSCKRAKELICAKPEPDNRVESWIESNLAQAVRSAGGSGFACPTEYKRFLGNLTGEVASTGPSPETLIAQMYPDSEVGGLMTRYFNVGRPKQIADELKRLRTKQAKKYTDTLDDLILNLDLVDGRYTTGQEFIRLNQPAQAEEVWRTAFESDAKILPAELKGKSSMSVDMAKQLSEALLKGAKDAMNRKQDGEAFKLAAMAFERDKQNPDINQLIVKFEKRAQKLIDKGDCESLSGAMEFSMPDSPIYKKAKQGRAENACP